MQTNLLADVYFAGLFDGEGSVIAAIQRNGVFNTRLDMGNTHRGVLDALHATYGGSIRAVATGSENKPMFIWSVTGKTSERFARAIFPHSIIKREQLRLYLLVRKTVLPVGANNGLSPEIWAERRRVAGAIVAARACP